MVRVRFAPSPTGLLHIGGLRTALYNFLFARQQGGAFLLRIEDTDQERYVAEAENDIMQSLAWAGLGIDEGPGTGGPHEPYHQSLRRETYVRYAQRLLDEGHAYLAFDTAEELDAMRERLRSPDNPSPTYDASSRLGMRNSLSLPVAEVDSLLDAGTPHVVRLKVDPGTTVTFVDLIRGTVTFETSGLDDQVLLKSDGLPTYHLANIVDDHLMGITHVIRGEEWLPSTPKHLLLYRFLGWDPPVMAHLPLILSPSGGKLSKRNAERMGIPVAVRQYREAGYEPEALVNFLAFLGWNPGTDQEVFDLPELVTAFSIDRVGSAGVQFNLDKLRWYNQQHLRKLDPGTLVKRARPALEAAGITADESYLLRVAELMQERLTFARELAETCRYFFEDPTEYDEAGVRKRWKDDASDLVTRYADSLAEDKEDVISAESAETVLRNLAEAVGVGAGRIIHPTRLALSGVTFGPGLFEMMEVLGRETCVRRLRRAVTALNA